MGLSGTRASWGDDFLGELEGSFDTIAYDHRGIGGSDPIDGPFTIADLAADAAALIAALELGSVHVLGISLGGMVAQELVLAAPDRVRTLTLGCTYCGGPGSRITDRAVISRLLAAGGSGDRELMLRTGFEINVSPAHAARPGAWEAFRERALAVAAPLDVVFEQLRATAVHDTSARLPQVTAPTLVVHGELDQMLDASNARQIAQLVPGARLELLEGVGHMFWVERPQRSAELLREHALAAASSAQ
jgi:pimeloyl-ACP methyl ester carboxylesterase